MQAMLAGAGLLIEFLSSQIDSLVLLWMKIHDKQRILLDFVPFGQLTPLFIPWACSKTEFLESAAAY